MKIKVTKYKYGRTSKFLDWWDNFKTSFIVFWDFKYKNERKKRKALMKEGEMERIPVNRAIKRDEKKMTYMPTPTSGMPMKYVKTKGGAVVVTPASLREIRKDYNDCELVEARIKSHADLEEGFTAL